MKNKLIGLMAMGAIIMMAGSAWAYDIDDHVVLGTDHRGDLLIMPGGVATGTGSAGWMTALKVINTSTEDSVVAKVVIRSKVYSQELLDFMIYLSPNDVWVGDIKMISWPGVVGLIPGVYSEDDSCLTLAQPPDYPTWASPADPFLCPLDPGKYGLVYADSRLCDNPGITTPVDTKEMFYVVITQAWCTPRDRLGPVPKDAIKDGYDLAAFQKLLVPDCVDYLTPMVPNPYSFAQPPVCVPPGTPGSWGEMTRCNSLTGVYQIINNAGDQFGANNMTALKNIHTARPLWVGEETILGYDTYNTLGEVEAVIAKNFVADYLKYDPAGGGQTLHSFLAPTWLPRSDGQGISDPPNCDEIDLKEWPMGPFFRSAMLGDCYCNTPACDAIVPQRTTITAWQMAWDLKEGPAMIISPPPDRGLLLFLSELTNVRPACDPLSPSTCVWGDLPFAGGVIPYVEGWARYGFVPALTPEFAGAYAADYKQWVEEIEPACSLLAPAESALMTYGAPLLASVIEFQSAGGVSVYNGAYQPGDVWYLDDDPAALRALFPNYPLTQGGPNPIIP